MAKKVFQKPVRKPRRTLGSKSRGKVRKTVPKRGLRTRRSGVESSADGRFQGMGRKDGCSAALLVVERVGHRLDRITSSVELPVVGSGGGAKFPRGRKGGGRTSKSGVELLARVGLAMFALGHVQRIKVIRKLLDGPASYQALKRLTKLKPGPLYHHVNQLRLAGMILPKQRDLYELTRAGRNMVLGIMVLAPLTHDSRRRPTA